MPSLTFYGGVREIGGNKVLLKDGDTKLFLDFGMSFSRRAKFYQEFLTPRTHSGVQDLLTLGLIPPLDNLYRDDPVGGISMCKEKPCIDAVLLSHPHADHANYISLLHPDIPVYASSQAWSVLEAMGEAGQTSFENEIVEYSFREPFQTRYQKGNRIFCPVYDAQPFQIGGIRVEPYLLDHSVPGAVGYILYTSAGPVAYSGDFRLHGPYPHLTQQFIDAMRKNQPRVFIVEGTNINEETGPSEEEVRQRTREVLISNKDQMVFCTFAPRDMYRLATIYEEANELGRRLVVNHKIAHLLARLDEENLNIPGLDEVLIYNQKKRWGQFDVREYNIWERPYLERHNSLRCEDLHRNPGSYIVYLDFFSMGELIDIEPPPGSVMLHSQAEPFNEEMEFDFERFQNWLERFAIRYDHAHASGHIYGAQLKDLIREIDPEILIPIHTEDPEAFVGLIEGVRVVEEGEEIII